MKDKTIDKHQVMILADAIQRYLETHPAASDTLAGISRWWLPSQRLEYPMESVREALQYLESRGLVEQLDSESGEVLYRKSH